MINNDWQETIDEIAQECYRISSSKGFHEDYFKTLKILSEHTEESEVKNYNLLQWFDSTAEQAEISRMHSELSEWIEGIRHDNPPDDHIPHLTSAEVEAADIIIRVLDTCAKRNYNIGRALIAKMNYNRNRPYKHGKNS